MTITEILAHANILTESGFTALADAVAFMNEAQDLIARWDMVRADPVIYTLHSNEIMLPEDLIQIARLEYNGSRISINAEPWGGFLTLPIGMTSGTLKVWYYRKPAVLLASTPTQVPEVGEQYHLAIAMYCAKQYFLIEDEPDMSERFHGEFLKTLQALKGASGAQTTFFNY